MMYHTLKKDLVYMKVMALRSEHSNSNNDKYVNFVLFLIKGFNKFT